MHETVRTINAILSFNTAAIRLEKALKKMRDNTKRRKAVSYFLRPACFQFLNKIPVRVVYHGLENLPARDGILFVGNHQSYFDIPILLACMEGPTALVAKKSVGKAPVVKRMIKLTESLLIDREDMRQSVEIIKAANERIKEGMNVIIFPEGTRSKTGEIAPFKRGSFRIASLSGAPVVPFRIDGARDIYENNPGIKVKSTEVHVYFGTPYETAGKSRAEMAELADGMREVVLGLQ